MAFAHTEKPRGAGRPMHNPSALDALSSLVRRGGHDIQADHIRKPVEPPPQGGLPQSPIAGELMARSQEMPMGQAPMGQMPMGEMPMEQMPMEQAPMPAEAPQEVVPEGQEERPDFPEPPYDGYYGEVFASRVKELKLPKGHWANEALKRFEDINKVRDKVRERIRQIEKQMAES